MEKILLKGKFDLKNAYDHFGIKYKEEIIDSIDKYPCVLVGNYCEDWEFGDIYSFTTIYLYDFERDNNEVFY